MTEERNNKEKEVPIINERILGTPSRDQIALYRLDEKSHPMSWLGSVLPMTQADDKYDSEDPNVKGGGVTKFSFSNWVG